jgi:hypothetical protein
VSKSTEQAKSDGLDLKQLAEVLIKHFGYHEGLFDATFQFKLAVGAVNPHSGIDPFPGAIVAIAGAGLIRAPKMNPHTVDAAKCNPLPTAKPGLRRKA